MTKKSIDIISSDTPIADKIEITDHLSVSDSHRLWKIIDEGFADLNRQSFERQSMTWDEFNRDMSSPNVIKCLVRDGGGDLVGGMLAHRGLDAVTWLEPVQLEAMRAEQDKFDPSGTSYHISNIVVSKSNRGKGVIQHLLRGAVAHLAELNGTTGTRSICFFDCAEANYPGLGILISRSLAGLNAEGIVARVSELPLTLAWVRGPEGSVEKVPDDKVDAGEVIDRQHIYAIYIDNEG